MSEYKRSVVFSVDEGAVGDWVRLQVVVAHPINHRSPTAGIEEMISGLRGANTPVIAAVYAALGDQDEAFRLLEKAADDLKMTAMVAVKEEPAFESLHSDPRWKVLLRRMNFPPE